jgi:hypothetical protein
MILCNVALPACRWLANISAGSILSTSCRIFALPHEYASMLEICETVNDVCIILKFPQILTIYANIEVPYRYMYLFHKHRRFNISFEGFMENETVVATTDGFDDRVITKEGENYFVAFARILNPRVYGHKIQPNQKFKAVTVVSDKTLWNLIFHGD